MLKLTDINFYFCLPFTKAQFMEDAIGTEKDFAKHLVSGSNWADGAEAAFMLYEKQILIPYKQMSSEYRRIGLNFFDHATLDIFRLNHLYRDVNIIFSHTAHRTEQLIEFSDRLVNGTEMLHAINNEYAGFLDLSVCAPQEISQLIKGHRPGIIIKQSYKPIGLLFWVFFYRCLFGAIKVKQYEYYEEAIESVITNIKKSK